MDSETALKLLGPYSWWQLRTYVVYAIGFGIPMAWMWMSIVFIGDTPAHRCALPANTSVEKYIPQICTEGGKCSLDQCHMYSDPDTSNETIPCPNGYWYDPASGYESTLVTDFDLVCSRHFLVEISIMLNNLGQAMGAFLFPILSDRYGRKPVFLGALWTNIIIAIMQAFSSNMIMYTILGFIDGFQQQGMISAAAVLAMELFPTEQRTFAGTAIELFWAFGYVSLLPFAYFIRNWRNLQLAITLPLVGTVVFYWFIAESIPWLMINNKRDQAEYILLKASKFNGRPLPEGILTRDQNADDAFVYAIASDEKETVDPLLVKTQGKQDKSKVKGVLLKLQNTTTKTEGATNQADIPKYTSIDIFKSKVLLLFSVILSFQWFIASVGYNAMSLTVTYLPGNRYLNFFLYSIIEVPAYIIVWILMVKIGRRKTIFLSHILGSIGLLLTLLSVFEFNINLNPLIIIVNLIGKTGFTMSFAALYQVTPELFPTNIRTVGLGIGQLNARIGGIVAPYARVLMRTQAWLVPLVIGCLTLVAAFTVLAIPETRDEPLPHTIEEVQNFKRK